MPAPQHNEQAGAFFFETVKAKLEKPGANSLSLAAWPHARIHKPDDKHQSVPDNAKQRPTEPVYFFDFLLDACCCIRYLSHKPRIQSIRDFSCEPRYRWLTTSPFKAFYVKELNTP